jgi:predicted acyl esterase
VVPLLCVGNWEGWSIKGYQEAASKAKWLRIETGDHLTPFYSDESLALQKRFFDHFLKGQDNGWENEAPVMVQVRCPDGVSWKKAAAWPLPGTQWDHYYLDVADGGMSSAKNGVSANEKSYPSMGDGATFKTEPFSDDVNFTGPGDDQAMGPIQHAGYGYLRHLATYRSGWTGCFVHGQFQSAGTACRGSASSLRASIRRNPLISKFTTRTWRLSR